jgi:hypothetical protein
VPQGSASGMLSALGGAINVLRPEDQRQ